jgi:hypothetical protein
MCVYVCVWVQVCECSERKKQKRKKGKRGKCVGVLHNPLVFAISMLEKE